MIIDEEFKQRILKTFQPLNSSSVRSFPEAKYLSNYLKEKSKERSSLIPPKAAVLFAKAAIEIWHRSIHSFLISLSLIDESPIWAAIIGYYSSHYSVRAIAHMLGYFYLYGDNKLFRLEFGREGTYSYSNPRRSDKSRSEHKLYWLLVKRNSTFSLNTLFDENPKEKSDSAHRNYANYIDFLSKYYNSFKSPLSKERIKNQIDTLSALSSKDISRPDIKKFPDAASVQLHAYSRIIIFRRILDTVLSNKNKFWNNNRNPTFAIEFMNYQLKDEDNNSISLS